MKTIGFPISDKEGEKRRVLLPKDIYKITNKKNIYVERGYGEVLGIEDDEYTKAGVSVVARKEVLACDVICDPKIGDAEYLKTLMNQTIFGWVHAVQNKEIADCLVTNELTAFAWEDMFEQGRHIFWRNNEIAGEAAIMHAYTLYGLFPYNTKVALIGRGNIGRGALKILNYLGAEVKVYDRKMEGLLRDELSEFDVVVNAVLWDTEREDHIIYKEDLKRMKKGAMIIDISCDRSGAIESSKPTTLNQPTYTFNGITHYAVDHTPTLFYKTISNELSNVVTDFFDDLITDELSNTLRKAKIVEKGKILDSKIISYQNKLKQT